MRRTGRMVALVFEATVLLILIGTAAYVSIGRILVANIGSFGQIIEARLSESFNVPVSFTAISGSWEHLDPTITLENLQLGNAETPAIELGEISARVHSLASLREGQIVISRISLDGISLSLRQRDDGRWEIVGLPGKRERQLDLSSLLASLEWLTQVDVQGVDVEVTGRSGQYHLSNQAGRPFALRERRGEKRLSMPLSFQESAERFSEFELVGRYSGDPRDVDDFQADLYMQVPRLELADFLPANGDIRVQSFAVRGQFWVESNQGLWNLRALPVVESLVLRRGDQRSEVLKETSATLVARGIPWRNVLLRMEDLEGNVAGSHWQLGKVGVAVVDDGESVRFGAHVPALAIAPAVDRFSALGEVFGIVDEESIAAIEALDPRGHAQDVHVWLQWPLRERGASDPVFTVAGRVDDLSLNSYRKSPAIASVDGFFAVNRSGGHLDLAGEAFEVAFPAAFDEQWAFDGGVGRIGFNWTNGYLQVASDGVRVQQGTLSALGRFRINLPQEPAARNWGLEVGIANGPLLEAHRYLPQVIGQELENWLTTSIEGGTVVRGGLVLHGTLDKSAPRRSKLFEMFFDVEDARLKYHPDWPAVQSLTALIQVGNWGVSAEGARGVVLGNEVTADVFVPIPVDAPVEQVLVAGNVSGALDDGLRMLKETPLESATGGVAETWSGFGDYTGSVKLDIPLVKRQAVDADVTVRLEGNQINMGDLDLEVADVGADIRYRTGEGLSSRAVDASLFGYPLSGVISSEATATGGAVRLAFAGRVDVEDLSRWSRQGVLHAAQGTLDYEATLHVPFGDRATELTWIEAVSGLEGVAIDLPSPVGKLAGDATSFRYRQSFLDEGYRFDVRLGELTSASIKTIDGKIVGGRAHFGTSPMGVVTYDSLAVTGALEHVEWARWEEASRYLETGAAPGVDHLAGVLDAVDVRIGRLEAVGLDFDDVRAHVTRQPGQWNVNLTNGTLAGMFLIPDDDELPVEAQLDYLRVAGSGTGEDLLADVDPATLPLIDFSVAELSLDGENFGKWRFQFRPGEQTAILDNLEAEVKGLSIGGDARVLWEMGSEGATSRFVGDILVSDLSKAFREWGFASSVEGENLRLEAALAWPGSPVMIDLDRVDGNVSLIGGSGRFVQAESGTGALRLLGIFDFDSLARRFRFDFRDVVDSGFTFKEITGRARLDDGVVRMVDPLVIVGAGSTIKVGGTVNLVTSKLDNDMVVTLPVSRNLPWYAAYSAIATGPLAGAGVLLAQKVFEDQINQMSSAKYRIEGTLDEPAIEFVSIFSDSVREVQENGSAERKPGQQDPGVNTGGEASEGGNAWRGEAVPDPVARANAQ